MFTAFLVRKNEIWWQHILLQCRGIAIGRCKLHVARCIWNSWTQWHHNQVAECPPVLTRKFLLKGMGSLFKTTEIFFGSTKMWIFYWETAFHTKKKNQEFFLLCPLPEPILGLFVLIWKHFFHAESNYGHENLNFAYIWKKKSWKALTCSVICTQHLCGMRAKPSYWYGGTPLIQLSIEKHAKPTLHDCNFTPHVTIFWKFCWQKSHN